MVTYETALDFRTALLEAGVLASMSVNGLYGRSREFQGVTQSLTTAISALATDRQVMGFTFPSVLPRDDYERTGYIRSFPDLLGSVDVFDGGDREHAAMLRALQADEDWASHLVASEVTLCSAACQPLYALMAGTLPQEGGLFEVETPIFRHEPSLNPMRMMSFHQREFVYLGWPDEAVTHRDTFLEQGRELLMDLDVTAKHEIANDPFFGRPAELLANLQRDDELKFELLVDIVAESPTAVCSGNRHLTHFAEAFGIMTSDGGVAHSSCVGFGLERIALALFARHGLRTSQWPSDVRRRLQLAD